MTSTSSTSANNSNFDNTKKNYLNINDDSSFGNNSDNDNEDDGDDDDGNEVVDLLSNFTDHLTTDSATILSGDKDRFNMVYISFYILGIGTLLPWNFFSNANMYFSYKLRNVTINNTEWENPHFKTNNQVSFLNYLGVSTLLPGFVFMLINIFLTTLISIKVRMLSSLSITLISFIITNIFTQVDTDSWQNGFLIFTLLTAMCMSASSAVTQGAILSLSSNFPAKYTQAVMTGMAMAGFFASSALIIVSSTHLHPSIIGLGYFLVSVVTLTVCVLSFIVLPKLTYARKYMRDGGGVGGGGVSDDGVSDDGVSDDGVSDDGVKFESVFQLLPVVLKKTYIECLTLLLIFLVTLSCFPAILAAVQSTSTNHLWKDVYFTPVVCFFTFNSCDLVGRSLAGFWQWPKKSGHLLFLSLLRLPLPVLMFFTNAQPRHHTIPIFTHDYFPAIFNAILGLTNGHIATLAMMYAPRKVSVSERQLTGSVTSLFIILGLAAGSSLSFITHLL